MVPLTDLQRRVLDVFNASAPTLEVIQMNERATDAWRERARQDPAGIEAYGLAGILALRRKMLHLYWQNTVGYRDVTPISL